MTFRVQVVGHMPGGEEWNNVLHFAGSATATTDVDDVLDRITTFYDTIGGQLSNAWGVDEYRIGQAAGPVLQVEAVTGLTGDGSSMPLPNDCAVMIRWRTAHAGRNGSGRTYICGALAGSVDRLSSSSPGVVSSSLADIIGQEAGTMAIDASVPLEVYSRVNGTGYAVTGGEVHRRWATQRRRDLETDVPVRVFPA